MAAMRNKLIEGNIFGEAFFLSPLCRGTVVDWDPGSPKNSIADEFSSLYWPSETVKSSASNNA